MFCDLVDSTRIAAKLDAEEWRDLVGACLDAASKAVTEMGGKVAKKLGDGLMALFGYPVAQENDAERAALAIQRSLAGWTARTPIQANQPSLRVSPSAWGLWWFTHRARYSAMYRTSQREPRPWPNRGRSWSRRGCSGRLLAGDVGFILVAKLYGQRLEFPDCARPLLPQHPILWTIRLT